MQRREFITLLGSAVAAWPHAARAQGEKVPRIGVLMTLPADDRQAQALLAVFVQGLQQLGWTNGRNLRIETRWGANSAATARTCATELVALAPDVVLATGAVTLAPLLQTTRSMPIVFVLVPDPVGASYIDSLARPGGQRHRIYPIRLCIE